MKDNGIYQLRGLKCKLCLIVLTVNILYMIENIPVNIFLVGFLSIFCLIKPNAINFLQKKV